MTCFLCDKPAAKNIVYIRHAIVHWRCFTRELEKVLAKGETDMTIVERCEMAAARLVNRQSNHEDRKILKFVQKLYKRTERLRKEIANVQE